MITPKPAPIQAPGKKTLAAIMGGVAAAAALMASLTALEGKKNVGYLDIVKVPTACRGTTKGAVVGRVYTDAQCDEMDGEGAIEHASGVLRCTPKLTPNQLQAATLLAYNIGVGGYCRSTVAKRFNAGDGRGACDAFRLWNKAGGRVIPGLVRRREYERAICLKAA